MSDLVGICGYEINGRKSGYEWFSQTENSFSETSPILWSYVIISTSASCLSNTGFRRGPQRFVVISSPYLRTRTMTIPTKRAKAVSEGQYTWNILSSQKSWSLVFGWWGPHREDPPVPCIVVQPVIFVAFWATAVNVDQEDDGQNNGADGDGDVEGSVVTRNCW